MSPGPAGRRGLHPDAARLWRTWGLPVVTGLLLALSFPPFSVLAAPFVALVPLVLSVEQLGPGREHQAALRGLMAGAVFWGVSIAWMPRALGHVTALAPLVFLLAVAVLAGFFGLFGWLLVRLRHSGRVPLWLVVPLAWTATEWLRAHMGPLAFPWLELGASLGPLPVLVAPAEVVGARGLSFWLALSAGLLAHVWAVSSRAPRRIGAVAWVAVLVLPPVWGAWRVGSLEQVPVGRVAVFQPHVEREVWSRPAASDTVLARLDALVRLLPAQPVDLGVWPEGTFKADPRRDPELARRISELVDRVGAPVLFGAHLRDDGGERPGLAYNGALLWTPGFGDSGYVYRKRRLVPGVEAVPALGRGAGRAARGFARGDSAGVAAVGETVVFAPLVCFESLFAGDARRGVSLGASVLVNLTNDEWFGTAVGGRPTQGMAQHAVHLVLRAVELRTGAARSANTGWTLFVRPSGHVSRSLPPGTEGLAIDTVWASPSPTVFQRAGDVAGPAAALVSMLLLLLAVLPSAGPSPPPAVGARATGSG